MKIKFDFIKYCIFISIFFQGYHAASQNKLIDGDFVIHETLESILATNPELSESQINDITERLTVLKDQKVNVNDKIPNIFSDLFLLTPLQITAIEDHKLKFGSFLEIYELQSISGFTMEDIYRILPFIKINSNNGLTPLSLKMLYEGDKTVLFRFQSLMQDPKGYEGSDSKYLGDKSRMSIRLRHTEPGRVSLGIGMEKDAGEPLNRNYNKFYFDFVTFHLSLDRPTTFIKKLVVGDFQASMGQGLILFSGYGYGKSAFTTNIVRGQTGLRSSTSVNEINAFRGLGVELEISKHLQFMAFYSHRKTDSNILFPDSLNNDEEIVASSIQMSGLHRTIAEIEDKQSLLQKTIGVSLKVDFKKLKIGLNGVSDIFNKNILPNKSVYNQYYFEGKNANNFSLDYNYLFKNVVLFGETGINKASSIATINGLLVGLNSKISMAVLYRNLPKEYYTLHGRVFSDQSNVTNEEGYYLGVEIKPISRVTINGYADFYKHKWPIFAANLPSVGSDFFLKITFIKKKTWIYTHNLDLQRKKSTQLMRINQSLN